MTLTLSLLTVVWLLASMLAVCLCSMAKRGDEAQADARRAAAEPRLENAIRTRRQAPPQRERVPQMARIRR